jgi:hypothetical protein
MAGSPKGQLSLDTNLPLDLAKALDFAHQFREEFQQRGYVLRLPPTVLADAGIPLLVTSDKHLLDIDEDALLLACNEADLPPVRPVHPKGLLRALR